MGLTSHSTGISSVDQGLDVRKQNPKDKIVAVAGNPNVGKSTVFNNLTGMRQHTGNWPGKTVANAQGYCQTERNSYVMIDIPGTYSLLAHSAEEEVARNFICFEKPDAVIVVCDACCLERNMNLVLQTLEITDRVVVCINLMDEARKKGICIDTAKLSDLLGVPVVASAARSGEGLEDLMKAVDDITEGKWEKKAFKVKYETQLEEALRSLEPAAEVKTKGKLPARWTSLMLLEGDSALLQELEQCLQIDIGEDEDVKQAVEKAKALLSENGKEFLDDRIVFGLVKTAQKICADTVVYQTKDYSKGDRKLDHILTSRKTGYPVMIGLLAVVLWLTIIGANYPSEMLSKGLFWLEDRLVEFSRSAGMPPWLYSMLFSGVYRVLAWVVSVMLPPMAIFFPLFTLLEDAGYLPRVAYNLDRQFKRCCTCGKQALTMCMGFGCNAAGIVGCRIIDSPRERLIAILTNSFVPCNGRFPTLILLISLFFVGTKEGIGASVGSAVLLTLMILLGIAVTLAVSGILSKTMLKGFPASFTLELPPFRKPQIGKVIVRSIFDRTLFVLARAAAVAAPAGLLIWIMANVSIGETTLLGGFTSLLDPFGRIIGLDGVILAAFILGFPANEIVVPVMIMAYLSQGMITETGSLETIRQLLLHNGWTQTTALCMMLFSLMHWPCSTTLLTIKKETGSLKWTFAAFLIPTAAGCLFCFLTKQVMQMICYFL
ncbi:ferrous iron transport protein B [Anaerostipes sp.]|uniref:ferrous iron transport protein B n=1 Tax=Anaerostipes sp. TaxID=1872530 RepID=UPI0025BB5E12|nr:ferrous iron transport protein B [Anaerostipes sp.]MBS7009584.1 ferrous iron transport protein B [Anaerostipes sp.]